MNSLDAHSEAHLVGVHPRLVACVRAAALICSQPFRVIEGLRTAERQAQLYAQGRDTPGPMVTWVRFSNHQAKLDGFGHAVDLAAMEPDGSIDWNDTAPYDTIYAAMFAAAAAMTPPLELRSGMDWNCNGKRRERGETDQDHFEIREPAAHAVAA